MFQIKRAKVYYWHERSPVHSAARDFPCLLVYGSYNDDNFHAYGVPGLEYRSHIKVKIPSNFFFTEIKLGSHCSHCAKTCTRITCTALLLGSHLSAPAYTGTALLMFSSHSLRVHT